MASSDSEIVPGPKIPSSRRSSIDLEHEILPIVRPQLGRISNKKLIYKPLPQPKEYMDESDESDEEIRSGEEGEEEETSSVLSYNSQDRRNCYGPGLDAFSSVDLKPYWNKGVDIKGLFDTLNSKRTEAGDYACSFIEGNAPNPGLHIAELGSVALPISDSAAEKLYHCESGEFGLERQGGATAKYFTGPATTFQNPLWQDWEANLPTLLKIPLGFRVSDDAEAFIKFDGLVVYPPDYEGSSPLGPTDSECDALATIAITLPSHYEGGDDRMSFEGYRRRFAWTESQRFNMGVVAWYREVSHETSRIIRGYKVVLMYSVYISPTCDKSEASYTTDTTLSLPFASSALVDQSIIDALRDVKRSQKPLIYGLKYTDISELKADLSSAPFDSPRRPPGRLNPGPPTYRGNKDLYIVSHIKAAMNLIGGLSLYHVDVETKLKEAGKPLSRHQFTSHYEGNNRIYYVGEPGINALYRFTNLTYISGNHIPDEDGLDPRMLHGNPFLTFGSQLRVTYPIARHPQPGQTATDQDDPHAKPYEIYEAPCIIIYPVSAHKALYTVPQCPQLDWSEQLMEILNAKPDIEGVDLDFNYAKVTALMFLALRKRLAEKAHQEICFAIAEFVRTVPQGVNLILEAYLDVTRRERFPLEMFLILLQSLTRHIALPLHDFFMRALKERPHHFASPAVLRKVCDTLGWDEEKLREIVWFLLSGNPSLRYLDGIRYDMARNLAIGSRQQALWKRLNEGDFLGAFLDGLENFYRQPGVSYDGQEDRMIRYHILKPNDGGLCFPKCFTPQRYKPIYYAGSGRYPALFEQLAGFREPELSPLIERFFNLFYPYSDGFGKHQWRRVKYQIEVNFIPIYNIIKRSPHLQDIPIVITFRKDLVRLVNSLYQLRLVKPIGLPEAKTSFGHGWDCGWRAGRPCRWCSRIIDFMQDPFQYTLVMKIRTEPTRCAAEHIGRMQRHCEPYLHSPSCGWTLKSSVDRRDRDFTTKYTFRKKLANTPRYLVRRYEKRWKERSNVLEMMGFEMDTSGSIIGDVPELEGDSETGDTPMIRNYNTLRTYNTLSYPSESDSDSD